MRRQLVTRKKSTAVMLLSALTGGMVTTQAMAQEASNDAPVYRFKMSVENEAIVPEWIVINHNYTPWQNDGPFGACTAWEPDPITIDWGQDFQQSRVCQQPQVRMATPVMLNPISKRTKLGDAFQESQTTPVADYQNNIGERDFITGERADDWPEWQNLRAPYDCSVWTPDRNEVRLYDPFTQSRDCSQDQTRSRNVYNVWASGQETAKRVDNDTQTITVSQTQPAVGQKDEIDGTRADTPTAWINDGGHYSCTAWTPLPVGQKSDYTQTRDCQQDQTRTQDHYDVWVSGKETLNRTENHDQTITETESRRVDVSYTNWVNQGDVENCEAWSPAPGGRTADYEQTRVCDQGQVRNRVYTADDQTLNTVEETQTIKVTQRRDNTMGGLRYDEWSAWTDTAATVCGAWGDAPSTQTSDFTQSRDCGTAQKRERDTFYTWAHSADTFRSVETETRTDPTTQTRSVSVSWTNWTNDGAVLNCTAWGDAPTTQTASYTQSRECDQKQTRDRIYKTGSTTLNTVEEDKVIRVTQTRTNKMEGVVYGDWSAYTDNAAIQCDEYSPAPAGQTTNFTQSRDCTQSQDRTRDTYYSWTYGDNTFRSTETGERDVPSTQTRTVNVSVSDWASTGNHSFGSYTPEPGTRTASYTQSRPYKQDQARTWTYTAGGSELHSRNETRTVDKTQSRTNTMEGLEYSGWSAFTNTGAKDCASWTPVPGSQTADYTQSRTCGTPQEQTRNVYYTWAHSAKTFKETETNSRIHGTNETRAVTVDYTNWTNNGGVNSCTAWSPGPGTRTSSYTQTRTCTQPQLRYRDYYVGGSRIERKSETQDIKVTQSRTNKMEGVAYGEWSGYSNNGSLSCGAYTPSASGQTADFTQSRNCEQPQKRTRATYYTWTHGANTYRNTETGTRDVDSTQTRNVDVAAGNWSATGNHSFTAWSPEPGSRTSSYTQSRSYKQNQERTWTYTADGSELHSRVQTQTVDKTQTRTNTMDGLAYGAWGPYINTGSTTCGAFSPAPSTQTDTFTQSKGCTTPQKRERDIFYTWAHSGNTFKETGVETRDAGSTQTRSVSVSWTGWANNGDVNSCSGWSPAPGSRTSSYTQTRTCTQPQLRHRDYYVGSTRIARKNETRNITVTQSRTNKMEGIAYGSWSSYSNDGGLSCGSYSPAAGTQTSDFTQSRDCDQKQKRTRTTYYTWTYGSNTYRNTETGTRNVDSTQSRNIDVSASGWSTTRNHSYGSWSPGYGSQTSSYTQTQGFKRDQARTWYYKAGSNTLTTRKETRTINDSRSRSVSVSWSGWSYTSGHHSCGGWTPSTSNYFTDETFTQTRACKRNQAGSYTHKVGSTTVHNYEKTRTVNSTDSRTATGTKPILVTESSTSCDAKQLYDTSYSSWSPSSGNQTSDYTQNRERTRKYKQYCYKKQTNQKTGAVSKVDGSWSYTTSKNGESRGVDVSVGGWDYDRHSYSSWSPSPGTRTSDFTQKRYYDRDGERIWTHKDKRNNSTIHTRKESSYHRLSQDRRVDVSAGSWKWTNTGWGHERFEPYKREVTYDYSQSRYYWKTRERTWYYKTGGSTISTRTQVDKPRYTETRTIDVNVYGWANAASKVCYGDWEPYGANQERQRCKQDQRRAVKTYTPDGTAYHHWQDQRWNYSWRYRTTYTPPPTPDCERYNDNIYEHCK